jgi:hypothetical protein
VSACPSVVVIVSRGNGSPGLSSGIAVLLHRCQGRRRTGPPDM